MWVCWEAMGKRGLRSEVLLLVDVDGVVTDEHARVDRTVVRQLAQLIREGAGVAFIAGRSRTWLEAQLVPPLVWLVGDRRL